MVTDECQGLVHSSEADPTILSFGGLASGNHNGRRVVYSNMVCYLYMEINCPCSILVGFYRITSRYK